MIATVHILAKLNRDINIFFKIVVSGIYGSVSRWVLSRLISASGSFAVGKKPVLVSSETVEKP